MPRKKIPIVAPPYPTLDGIELDANSISINDGYLDEASYLVKRPGLVSTHTLGSSSTVDGIADWEGLSLTVAVSNTICYTINSGGTITDISTTTSSFLQARNRPSFAFAKINNVEYMAVANGGAIYISTDGGDLAVVSDAQAPTDVTHLAFVNKRLVANQIGSDVVRFSAFEDPTDWQSAGFFTAESESDAILAIYKSYNEIAMFGVKTIEFWYNTGDSTTPFAIMQGTNLNIGLAAPYAVTYDPEESAWYFLDSQRNVNKMVNHQFQSISKAIDGPLQDITNVDNARFDLIYHGSHKFVLCTFPEDEVTYVFDTLSGYWSQWGKYNTATGFYEEFLGRSIAWIPSTGKTLVGSNADDGIIYEFDSSTYTDGGSDIRTAILTGWVDCGTSQSKNWKILNMRTKRQGGTGFTFQLRYRRDYVSSFVQERGIDFDDASSSSLVVRSQKFGIGRAIQFEFYMTEDSPFIIGNFELEYTENRS